MKRILPIILSIVVLGALALVAVLTITVLTPKPEQAEEKYPGMSVFSEEVIQDDLVFKIRAQGEVRPQREITVAPQISGRIAYVSPDFIDGGFIRRGQTLVRLEAADYELAVVRARSGVASARQRLAREQAEAEIARQDLINLGITESSPLARREPQLAEAEAALDSARAQLADAELSLRRTAVQAPFDGRVRSENVDVGQFAGAGQSLGMIFATDIVEVVLPMTDEQLGQLGLPLAFAETDTQAGPETVFSANVAGKPRRWTGRVTRTSAAINPQTRLINVIAELDDPYGKGSDDGAPMAPGLFVQAELSGIRIDGLLKAPRAALRSGNNLFLGDPEKGQLRIQPVDLVHADPDGAWFRSDAVSVGDLALTSPIRGSNDGMSLTILQRLPDGTILNHNRERQKDNTSDPDASEQMSGTISEGEPAQ